MQFNYRTWVSRPESEAIVARKKRTNEEVELEMHRAEMINITIDISAAMP